MQVCVASALWPSAKGVAGGFVWRTSDGGPTWEEVSLPGGLVPDDVGACGGVTACWLVAAAPGHTSQGTIVFSADGGSTWTPQDLPADAVSSGWSAMSCPDPADCWLAGASSTGVLAKGQPVARVVTTADGGQDWSSASLPDDGAASPLPFLQAGSISCSSATSCVALAIPPTVPFILAGRPGDDSS